MIREVYKYPDVKLFKDDDDLYSTLLMDTKERVIESGLYSGNISNMMEGETVFDYKNLRTVTKIKGSLYISVVKDNEVVFKKLVRE